MERRGESLDDGLRRLRQSVAALPADTSASEAADALVAAMADEGPRHDDIALVVVRDATGRRVVTGTPGVPA